MVWHISIEIVCIPFTYAPIKLIVTKENFSFNLKMWILQESKYVLLVLLKF